MGIWPKNLRALQPSCDTRYVHNVYSMPPEPGKSTRFPGPLGGFPGECARQGRFLFALNPRNLAKLGPGQWRAHETWPVDLPRRIACALGDNQGEPT